MNPDPFLRIDAADMDKDTLLKLTWLACQCREQSIALACINGWILPLCAFPWTPERATALRRTLHHTERVRGFLQSHVEAFPSMGREDAQAWLEDLRRHHGEALPCWWSKAVVGVAESIIGLAGGGA